MGAVALLVVLVLLLNWNNRATVWFFHEFKDVPVIGLLVVTGLGSVAVAFVTRGFFNLLSEWRRLRREKEFAEQFREHKKLSDELARQEKRIDEKLKESLQSPAPVDPDLE